MKKKFISAGAAAATLLAGVASAQTTTPEVPGAPAAGMGGEMILNFAILGLALVVAVAGAVYAYRLH